MDCRSVSFVFPRPRWSIAAYRHELAHFSTDVQSGGFFGSNPPADPTFDGDRRLPIVGNTDLTIAEDGVSGIVQREFQRLDWCRSGLLRLPYGLRTDRFDIVNDFEDLNYRIFTAGRTTRRATSRTISCRQEMIRRSASTWAPCGCRAESFSWERYSDRADFDIRIANLDPSTDEPFDGLDRQGTFHVPHVFGIGTAVRPSASSTIVFDIARVGYSRLTDDFIDIFNDADDKYGPYTVRDGTEVHAGFEYFFIKRVPIALRTGYWLDPEHALEVRGTGGPGREGGFQSSSRGPASLHVRRGCGLRPARD